MRRLILGLSIALALLSAAPVANAQGGFILGFLMGSASSGTNETPQSGMGNVIYVMPRLGERLKEPLAVRFATSGGLNLHSDKEDPKRQGYDDSRLKDFAKGRSLQEIFVQTVKNSERYTLLAADRFIIPNTNYEATFSFAYIETEKLVPVSELKLLK